MRAKIPEKLVQELWQNTVQYRPGLRTEDGRNIRIIYPGRPNDGRGADLRDAVIAAGREIQKGDIEIHVNSSDWPAHGHHQDPAYNRVALHVVYHNDTRKNARRQNGREVPTLDLRHFLEHRTGRVEETAPSFPAVYRRCERLLPGGRVGSILETAGDERFENRAASYREGISANGPAQVLYRGILTALGYSKNKEAMADLADFLPAQKLEGADGGDIPEATYRDGLQALMLGTAGLLPSQRHLPGTPGLAREYVGKLEGRWAAYGQKPQMKFDDWRYYKVRPGNIPIRRIVAMSYLLTRYRGRGLLYGWQDILGKSGGNGHLLEGALCVPADGYWGQYYDFGLPVRGRAPALLGRDRAADIIVNVLLPFYATLPEQADTARKIWQCYRPPAENSLEKHVRQQLNLKPADTANARRRQGLIHIYKTYCTQGRCRDCPLATG